MRKYLDLIYFNRKEIIIALIMLTGFFIFKIFNNKDVEIEPIKETIEEKQISKIIIDIKGEVNNPGSYEIDDGKRIKDAIELAGGLTKEAYIDNINLSSKLNDEMLIIIPKKEEQEEKTVIKDTKISINTANINELMNISGIGKSKAQSIIDYRNKHGRFNSINDIMNVSGIGQSTFDKIKDYIKV